MADKNLHGRWSRKAVHGIRALCALVTLVAIGCGSDDPSVSPSQQAAAPDPPVFTAWSKTAGGAGYDYASSAQQTLDGGYIMAGGSDSFGAAPAAWVVKYDFNGAPLWQYSYSGAANAWLQRVVALPEGGYVAVGGLDGEAFLLKLNEDGTAAWSKRFGSGGALDAARTSDGGYVVAAYTNAAGAGSYDLWVLKLTSAGEVSWQRTYGGSGNEWAYGIHQTSDDGYFIGAISTSFGNGSYDAWVLKVDAAGDVVFQEVIGDTSDDWINGMARMTDGAFVLTGSTNSFLLGSYDFWAVKVSEAGVIEWQMAYGSGGYENATSVAATSDGGCIVAGGTTFFGLGGNDVWAIKLAADGTSSWQMAYGGTGADVDNFVSVRQISTGEYVIAANTASAGAGGSDAWVFTVNADGTIAFTAESGMSHSVTAAAGVTTTAAPVTTNCTVTTPSLSAASASPTGSATSATFQQQAP